MVWRYSSKLITPLRSPNHPSPFATGLQGRRQVILNLRVWWVILQQNDLPNTPKTTKTDHQTSSITYLNKYSNPYLFETKKPLDMNQHPLIFKWAMLPKTSSINYPLDFQPTNPSTFNNTCAPRPQRPTWRMPGGTRLTLKNQPRCGGPSDAMS